jgi:hypothetical protein
MTLPLALLFAVFALSTLYALDVSAARTESLRLLFSLGTFALVPFFVRDRASLRWTLYAFVFGAAALSLAGIYQQATDTFFWNAGLGLYGERRINTTFADPNHLARFLLEAIVVAMMLWFFAGRRMKFGFLLPSMALAVLTLVFTGSRGAWVVGAMALPAAVMALPIERSLRLRMLGMGAALLVPRWRSRQSMVLREAGHTFTFSSGGARPYPKAGSCSPTILSRAWVRAATSRRFRMTTSGTRTRRSRRTSRSLTRRSFRSWRSLARSGWRRWRSSWCGGSRTCAGCWRRRRRS